MIGTDGFKTPDRQRDDVRMRGEGLRPQTVALLAQTRRSYSCRACDYNMPWYTAHHSPCTEIFNSRQCREKLREE